MGTAAPRTGQVDSFTHHAFLYADEKAFLEGTRAFVEDGLAADEEVLVALPEPRLRMLRSALGPQAKRVQFADMVTLGRNPNLIISAWRDFVDRTVRRGRPARGIGEPAWPGRRPAEYAEAALHEALLNVAFDDGPPWLLMCPYDTRALDREALDSASATHPAYWDPQGEGQSDGYAGKPHARALLTTELDPPTGPEIPLPVEDPRALRLSVAQVALAAGLVADRVEQLSLAAYEVATNAHRHGELPASASTWTDPTAVTVEIRDSGHFADLLAGRLRPGLDHGSGRGLWMANHLCDLVQVRTSPRGTTVRLICWLPI